MFSKKKKSFKTFLFYLAPKNWPVVYTLTAIELFRRFCQKIYTSSYLLYLVPVERKSSGSPSSFRIS